MVMIVDENGIVVFRPSKRMPLWLRKAFADALKPNVIPLKVTERKEVMHCKYCKEVMQRMSEDAKNMDEEYVAEYFVPEYKRWSRK